MEKGRRTTETTISVGDYMGASAADCFGISWGLLEATGVWAIVRPTSPNTYGSEGHSLLENSPSWAKP